MTALLTVQEASVHFGGIRALDGVSLVVEEGVACGIFGPNGSGKTTLLGAISRLTPLTSGALAFAETDYTRLATYVPCRIGIARTFQSIRLLEGMTVLKNVMVGAAVKVAARPPVMSWLGLVRAVHNERSCTAAALQALELVGMASFKDSYPHDLPYGLQRRVEIARALATSPRLLLLDEPMAGMNRSERSEISDLLLQLKETGLTIVLVEHDLPVIHQVCDTSYALDFGKVIGAGPSRDVAQLPAVQEAYLGRQAAEAKGDAHG